MHNLVLQTIEKADNPVVNVLDSKLFTQKNDSTFAVKSEDFQNFVFKINSEMTQIQRHLPTV
jgi:hypothetical protein